MRYYSAIKKNGIFLQINAGEGVEKREPSYTVDGNVNWCSYYGKQYRGSSETKNRFAHIILQSHS